MEYADYDQKTKTEASSAFEKSTPVFSRKTQPHTLTHIPLWATFAYGNQVPPSLRLPTAPGLDSVSSETVSHTSDTGGSIQLALRAIEPEEDVSGNVIHQAAQEGIQTPSSELPHRERIQEAFGHHEVGQVQAHLGAGAAESATAMHAKAYAIGNHVVFAETPDLHVAAHEAAHIVQQRGNVQLVNSIGKVGDRYEQHANVVAERVAAGQSAEDLLDSVAGRQDSQYPSSQGQRADDGQAVKTVAKAPVQMFINVLPGPQSTEKALRLDIDSAVTLFLQQGLGDHVRIAAIDQMVKNNWFGTSIQGMLDFARELSKTIGGPTLTQVHTMTGMHTVAVASATKDLSGEDATSDMLRGIPSNSSFSGKKEPDGSLKKSLVPDDIKQLAERVDLFDQFSQRLAKQLTSGKDAKITLYRAMKINPQALQVLKVGDTFDDILPFSTTFSFEFAYKWADQPESVVFEINTPVHYQMVILSHLGPPLQGVVPLNQGQLEVALAPSQLQVLSIRSERKKTVVSVDLAPIPVLQVQETLKSAHTTSVEAQQNKPKTFDVPSNELVKVFGEEQAKTIMLETSIGKEFTTIGGVKAVLEIAGNDRFDYTFQVQ